MRSPTIEQELDALLGESAEAARQRAASHFVLGDAPLVLYGAGNLGQSVVTRLRRAGVEPAAFADDTPAKQGTTIEGLRVMPVREVVKRFGRQTVFAVTIFNPQTSFLAIARRVREATDSRIVSFMSLAWRYPEHFLPHYQFELPQHILAKAPDIRRGFDVFADDESRRQFVAHLRFRLWLDFEALPASGKGDYFPSDVIGPLPGDTRFVDCGAYDGDTVRRFLKHQRGEFGSIYAFEPDPINVERLRDYVATLDHATQSKVHIFHAGAGGRRQRLPFNATGNMGATFDGSGDFEVDVLPVHDVVPINGSLTYLKLDVEGAERDALEGAEKLIRGARPVLAISVYHRPDDLWKLPLCIHELGLGYRLFLRTQGEDGVDVVCYAVPPKLT